MAANLENVKSDLSLKLLEEPIEEELEAATLELQELRLLPENKELSDNRESKENEARLETIDCSALLPSVQKEKSLLSNFCQRFCSEYHFDYVVCFCMQSCFFPCVTCNCKECRTPNFYSVLFVLSQKEKQALVQEDEQALDLIGRQLSKLKRLDLTHSNFFWDFYRNKHCINTELYDLYLFGAPWPINIDILSQRFSAAAFQILILKNCNLVLIEASSRMGFIRTLLKMNSLRMLDLSDNRLLQHFKLDYCEEIGVLVADSNLEEFRMSEASWEHYIHWDRGIWSQWNNFIRGIDKYKILWESFAARMKQKQPNGMNFKSITLFNGPLDSTNELFPMSQEISKMYFKNKLKPEIDRIHASFEHCATPLIFQYLFDDTVKDDTLKNEEVQSKSAHLTRI